MKSNLLPCCWWTASVALLCLLAPYAQGQELYRLPAVYEFDAFPDGMGVQLTAWKNQANQVEEHARQAVADVDAEADQNDDEDSQDADTGKMTDEPLGKAPEDNSLQFLRTSTPLLQRGQVSVDYGFRYIWKEIPGLSVLPDGSLTTGRIRTRRITSPLGLRYGYTPRTQLFLSAPVGFSILDRADLARQDVTTVFGGGDISGGINYTLINGTGYCPDVIGAVGVSVPTGAHPFQNSPGPAALGSGFWGVTSSLFAVRQTDPAVVFGGIGYSHQFDRSFLGIDFDPGESIFYQLGAGFSVNTELTFTTTFQGGYQFKLRANDIEIPNSAQEPLSLRFAMVMTHCKSYVIEPFVNFGLTPDASDADFGVIVTRTR